MSLLYNNLLTNKLKFRKTGELVVSEIELNCCINWPHAAYLFTSLKIFYMTSSFINGQTVARVLTVCYVFICICYIVRTK